MFYKKIFSTIFYFLMMMIGLSAQTVGVTQSNTGSLEGYTFFSPYNSTRAFMVDHCGRLINEWDRGTRPGLSAYFLENGLMFRTYKVDPVGPFTSASNAGGLELVDWDNNVVWSWELNTSTNLSHHDAVFLPNGNILTLSWELVFENELIELGRNPNSISNLGYMWSERILELEPTGSSGANIVWEWRLKDHFIQNFDESKLNFGIIADHPELFDINSSGSGADWFHCNAIDYHPELDQILISARNPDEVWVIDHSTTTEEAASHSGGQAGKGGDLLYRWGNPIKYGRGTTTDQKLYGQHGIQWIRDGSDDDGKIIMFNNGNGRPGPDFSAAEMISPPLVDFNYTIDSEEPFGPVTSEIIYGEDPGTTFFSPFLSNAQRLPNKHTLINQGSSGIIFEVDDNQNVLWEYTIPLFGDFPATQGQIVNNNSTFRAYRYFEDFPGFVGLDLSPGATIETGDNPLGCSLTATAEVEALEVNAYYDQTQASIVIDNATFSTLQVRLFDTAGQLLFSQDQQITSKTLKLQNIKQGIFFLQIQAKDGRQKTIKIPVF